MRTCTENLMATNGLMPARAWGGNRTGKAHLAGIGKHAKNVALFLAAPFIGLAYLLAFPVIGFALLAWVAARAVMDNDKARPVALALAAPFIGLAFVTAGPVLGLVALAWHGGRAVMKA
jgi:hypothetical protein